MKPLPLRWKVALWSAAITGGVVLFFAAGVLFNVYREELDNVDLALRNEAREAIVALDSGNSLNLILDTPPLYAFAVTTASGRVVQTSRNFPADLLPHLTTTQTALTVHQRLRSWRLLVFPWRSNRLGITADLTEVRDVIFELAMAGLLTLPLAMGLAAWGGWFVAGRALAPVRRAALAAGQISGHDLDRRLPVPETNDDIGHLTNVLNRMLDRIERSYRQAERFAADASHELRTPLTVLRGEIDQLLQHRDTPVAIEEKLVSLQEELLRLDRITEQLLLLAKLDAGRVNLSDQPLDLSALAQEACDDIDPLVQAADLVLTRDITAARRIRGEPVLLRQLTMNLLENAVHHNVPHGWIKCTLKARATWVDLVVTNSCVPLAPEQRDHLFDRFYRAASIGAKPGHGLGLSLCHEIVRIHDGSLSLAPEATDGTLSLVASFPSAPPSDQVTPAG